MLYLEYFTIACNPGEAAFSNVTYARHSPVIIVLVIKDDTILITRSKHAPPECYRVVAGFIEPCEIIEHAVERVVLEEPTQNYPSVHTE
jgi:NAD+ diphosphatase